MQWTWLSILPFKCLATDDQIRLLSYGHNWKRGLGTMAGSETGQVSQQFFFSVHAAVLLVTKQSSKKRLVSIPRCGRFSHVQVCLGGVPFCLLCLFTGSTVHCWCTFRGSFQKVWWKTLSESPGTKSLNTVGPPNKNLRSLYHGRHPTTTLTVGIIFE